MSIPTWQVYLYAIGPVVALTAVVLWNARGQLSPFLLTLATLMPTTVGYWLLDQRDGTAVATLYTLSLLTVTLGYISARHFIRPERGARTLSDVNLLSTRWALKITTAVILFLVVYHFQQTGLPLFATNIEEARYDFTGSGLAGLPGRAFLFGIPLLTVGAILLHRQWPDDMSLRRTAVFIIVMLVASRLVSGFRSALVEAIVILFFAGATTGSGLRLGGVVKRFAVPLLLAGVFALQLSGSYATLAGNSQARSFSVLLERATTLGAEAGHIVMQPAPVLDLRPASTVINDINYYVYRYGGVGKADQYAFSQIVAASIFDQSLSGAQELVPVTIGGFPQFYYDFSDLAFLVFALIGALYAYAESLARRAHRLVTYVPAMAGIFILNDFITKGNLIYTILNWGAVAVFLLVLLGTSKAAHRWFAAPLEMSADLE